MTGHENRRETGATKYPARSDGDPADSFSQHAAGNKPPASGQGLTRPSGEVNEKTHQSDGQNPSRRATPDQPRKKGAGSATFQDDKVPPGDREPGP